MSIPLTSNYGNVFVHRGVKLENLQPIAKNAPNCIPNFKTFPGWHPGPLSLDRGHPLTRPPAPLSVLRASTRGFRPLDGPRWNKRLDKALPKCVISKTL